MHMESHRCEIYSVTTDVRFRRLTEEQTFRYLKNINPLDKAGGYAIQEHGEMIVESIHGSFTNVVGLPVEELGSTESVWHRLKTGLNSTHSVGAESKCDPLAGGGAQPAHHLRIQEPVLRKPVVGDRLRSGADQSFGGGVLPSWKRQPDWPLETISAWLTVDRLRVNDSSRMVRVVMRSQVKSRGRHALFDFSEEDTQLRLP